MLTCKNFNQKNIYVNNRKYFNTEIQTYGYEYNICQYSFSIKVHDRK